MINKWITMNNKCKVCNTEISRFMFASEYRKHGFCREHLPVDLYCTEPDCYYPKRGKANFCKAHKIKRARQRKEKPRIKCSGITKLGVQCKKNVYGDHKFCKVHTSQQPYEPKRPAQPIKAKNYKSYVASPEWAEKSKIRRSDYGNRCAVCNSTKDIHAHHRTYERLGLELPEDITPM